MQDGGSISDYAVFFAARWSRRFLQVERGSVYGQVGKVNILVAFWALPFLGILSIGAESLFDPTVLEGYGNDELSLFERKIVHGKLLRFQGRNVLFPNTPATEVMDAFVGWVVGVVGIFGTGIWLFVTGAAWLAAVFVDAVGLAFALLCSAIATGLIHFAIFFACCFLLFFFLVEVGSIPHVHHAVVVFEAYGCGDTGKVGITVFCAGDGIGHGEFVYPGARGGTIVDCVIERACFVEEGFALVYFA